MKKNLNFPGLILIAALAYSLSACNPVFYAPNAHNVPLLKEKHETRLNLGMTTTEDLTGPDLQAAYAVGKNIGIIANGTYLKGGSEGSNWEGHGYQAEIGSGYFKPVGRFCVAEIYGGAGFAKITNQRYEDPFSLKFIKPFLQPAFGFNSTYFEVAFSPKIASVHYDEPFILEYELLTDANGNIMVDQNGQAAYKILKERQTFFDFEPGLTIRGGWKYTKLQIQAVKSFQEIPESQDLRINLSLTLNLAPRFRKAAE